MTGPMSLSRRAAMAVASLVAVAGGTDGAARRRKQAKPPLVFAQATATVSETVGGGQTGPVFYVKAFGSAVKVDADGGFVSGTTLDIDAYMPLATMPGAARAVVVAAIAAEAATALGVEPDRVAVTLH